MSSAGALRSVPLFSALPDDYLDGIAKLARERSYAPGQNIVRQGDKGLGLYIITAGRVAVVQRARSGEHVLNQLAPGEWFGELALLTHRPRLATVRALEPTTCLIILSVTFDNMLDHSPQVGRELCRYLARRLEEADNFTRYL